ncbi:hypothetical protein [Acidovorax sp.]|uniref:hypothetical protein n=1 Tax=Acidovorax sp. TaxID=1872122 RepID=UPI0026040A7B|nr:hypothetical protein [Acidovorax sp.]
MSIYMSARQRAVRLIFIAFVAALVACGGGGANTDLSSTGPEAITPDTPAPVARPTPAPTSPTPAPAPTSPAPAPAPTSPAPAPAPTSPTPAPAPTSPAPTPAPTAPIPISRGAPDWSNYEPPKNWDYQAVYPSRSACAPGEGLIFDVGPGKTYAAPKNVPWLTLLPCDIVNIHYRAAPYTDIIFLASRGRHNKWITIQGVAGPNGELPVLDGTNAVMPKDTGANRFTDAAGMIVIKTPDVSAAPRSSHYKPGYLHITGLKISNVRPPQRVVKLSGNSDTWALFSAGIYIDGAEQVAVTYCDLGDNGMGIFANSGGGEWLQTRNLLIARNHFHGNGNKGSFSEHNAYTEGIGTIYEYNYFAPPVRGSNGDNIKERSAGVIVRYNYIEGGADLVALRDPESNVDYESVQVDAFGEKLVANAFVYGNILVAREYLQAIVGHGDGDMGTKKQPREGNLFFYNNRVASFVDNEGFWRNNNYFPQQAVPLIGLLNTRAQTTVVARNNLLYAASATPGRPPAPIGLFYYQGRADYEANWTNGFALTVDPYGGTNLARGVKWNGINVRTNTLMDGSAATGLTRNSLDPGFVDAARGNFLTTAASPYATLSGTLPAAVIQRGLVPSAQPVVAPPVK